jgi:hypothetical protein
MRDPEVLGCKELGLGQCPSSNIFRQNNICMSAIVGSQYGATTGAAESLIAHGQIHSQGRLTTPSRGNRKIRQEIEILKATKRLNKV